MIKKIPAALDVVLNSGSGAQANGEVDAVSALISGEVRSLNPGELQEVP